ncbi:MAG TPA: DUF58 domain-containing protein [Polyangia bacterium]
MPEAANKGQGPTPLTAAAGRTRAEVDLAALMRLGSLELRAKVIVQGLWRGLHRSPFHGFSVEFTEYRPYSPGDDVRFLDWRLYARSDRDYVKKYEDETNLRCQLLVDQSRSMAFRAGAAYSKADYGATVAATLASFLFAQGDAVGVTTFAGAIAEHLPARNRPGHLRRLMLALERPADGRESAVGKVLEQINDQLRRRGMVVLISDLLVPPAECERPLAALRAAGHEVLVLQVIDPVERTLAVAGANNPWAGPLRLRDLETDAELDVDLSRSGAGYRHAFADHLDAIGAICARLGVERHVLMTDRPIEEVLAPLIAARSNQRGRR